MFLAFACHPPAPLPERPVILHALAEQEETVQALLAEMRDSVTDGRFPTVELIDFVVVDDEFEWWGTWSGDERTIRVDHSLEGRLLADVVRHELCHAIDEQSGFKSGQRPWPALPIPTRDGSDAARRKELFADLCGLGEPDLALLRTIGHPCLPPDIAAAADEIGEWVYPSSADAPEAAPTVVHRLAPPEEGAEFSPWVRSSWFAPTAHTVYWRYTEGRAFVSGLDVDTFSFTEALSADLPPTSLDQGLGTSQGTFYDVDELGLGWLDVSTILPDGRLLVARELRPRWSTGAEVAIPLLPGPTARPMAACVAGADSKFVTGPRAIFAGATLGSYQVIELTSEVDAAFGEGWKVPFEELE
jgi:hypothetical protein